jgi:hypothetical protein
MRISPERLAASMAREDGVPRILRQFTTFFLATPTGEVWRVFESDDVDGARREAPTADSSAATRVFVASEERDLALIYRFQPDDSRALTAESLYAQLQAAVPCDAG